MKMNRLFFIISILVIVLLASCGKQPEEESPVEQEAECEEIQAAEFTPEEIAWINEKRKSGKLIIATVASEDTYMVHEDGSISGFDYKLAHNLAQTLGLTLEVRVQEDATTFFAKDGVFNLDVTTDPDISYTPDLLYEVDIFAGPFSIVPWREKLMRFVPMMPVGQVLASREGEEIEDITELDGKRLAVLSGSYQETLITRMMAEKGFSVVFAYMQSTDDPLDFVKSGNADYLIDGAVYMARGMRNLEGLSVSPVKIDLVTIGWAVRKDNNLLKSILGKFIDKSLFDGSFGRLWKENSGVDFDYYLKLVTDQ